MAEFKLPPISTLAGSTFFNYIRVLKKGEIERKYYLTVLLTLLIVLIASPFHLWEKVLFGVFKRKPKGEIKPPLFILGHWRSGTTLLHNLLCQDPAAGYVTTYHSLFPTNLGSKLLFKTFMKLNMPDKRPSDGMALSVDYPQEDDFAIGNLSTFSYYHFFYFPKKFNRFYEQSVRFRNNSSDAKKWKKTYQLLINKALINTSGQRAVLKSPVNTGRVNQILKMNPEAKFIYIYRNPFAVYLSTFKFFDELFPTLWFHEVSYEFIENLIFEIFSKLIQDYEAQKHLIPKENLIEIRFEEFEKNPLDTIRLVYSDLLADDFERFREILERYLDSVKSHKKNAYTISRRIHDRIQKEWKFYIDSRGYTLPDNIHIKD
ncbi:MAG: sulfotransferase [Bacteroidota bacterium]